ncbi:MAG: pyridoxal-5'-phosphate-dependent protein subunit beta [Alphaproteobacteria bacterium]|nr:pyridoxal-5'-phosphate-dependent protein subunit beta [Alphaproteobacteria bacterium]
MNVYDNIIDAVGQTPLVRLNKVVPPGAAQILAKCEYMNPTGSIKDRMATYIIEKAEKEGLLSPGGTIIENTSGNTGQSLAMVAAVKGYKCIFTLPDKMSQEKIDMMKAYGAKVVITPTDVPGDSPEHYVNKAKAIAAETPGSFYVDQYHSEWNIEAHRLSTGREIFEQTNGGKIDVFMGGTGTGGTVSGVGRWFKEHAPNVKIIGVDPLGSVHYHLFNTGCLPTAYVYKVEGIGEDIECEAMDFSVVDEMRQVNDKQSFDMARKLLREEGLFCGGSSGSIVHSAIEVALELGPNKTIVVTLSDSGNRYISKFLSDDWMKEQGLIETGPDLGLVEDLLTENNKSPLTAFSDTKISEIIRIMRVNSVSQIPVIEGGKITGMIHESDILRGLREGVVQQETSAGELAAPIGGLIYPKARIEELYFLFQSDHVAVVIDEGKVIGIISQIDLIEHITKKTDKKFN